MVKPGKIENIQIFEFAPKFNFFLFSTIVQFLNFEDQAPTLKIGPHMEYSRKWFEKSVRKMWFVECVLYASGSPRNISGKSEELILPTLLSKPLFFCRPFCPTKWPKEE